MIISNVTSSKILLSTNKSLTNRTCEGSASTSFDFQLEALPTFNEMANFAVSGLPSGATASFLQASTTTTANNTLTISNLNNVPAGSYQITVTATSSSATSNLFFILIVQNSLTTSPTLSLPANNATQVDINPTLSWVNVGANVASYTIEIAKDSNFTTSLQTLNSVINEVTISNLDYGTVYFWRVKSNNVCGESSFSMTNTFSTPCSSNIEITITENTVNGATVSWTNPNATDSFQILVVPARKPCNRTLHSCFYKLIHFYNANSASNYTVYVKSACSGNIFSTSVNKNFSTLVNHCVDGYFRDSGGLTGNYTNGEYVTTVMSPVNIGDEVSVTFTSFNLENGADNLKIYNGPDTNSPFIVEQYGFTGTNNPGTVTSTHPSGKLTFVFYSDGATTASGWNATVTCANLETTSYTKTNFTYYPNPASTEVNFKGTETINSISNLYRFRTIG